MVQTDGGESDGFYASVGVEHTFDSLAEDSGYTPVPDDWFVGCADIIGSTALISAGRYKTVNTIGAAVISAQLNAFADTPFPYSFGGDGAAFAMPPKNRDKAADALAAVRRWAKNEFDIDLRTAIVPVAEIRSAGHDVRVARFRVSHGVDYAMFAGGGVSWAEARMKAGAYDVPIAPPDTIPDLTGLSCRWTPMRAENGSILSLVIAPGEKSDAVGFARVIQSILDASGGLRNAGHPVPPEGPGFRWVPEGLELEARATHGRSSLFKRKIQLLFETFIALIFFRTGWKAGDFDPVHYTRTCGTNADFRKFEDGLKMTLDADEKTLVRIRSALEAARAEGIVRYGIHVQNEAIMTCIVPSITTDEHVHFIDGADGGYATAAARMKEDAAA